MEEINIKELFDYATSKIFLIVLIMIITLILGNVYSIFIKTPMYKSTTKLVLVSESNTITQSDVTLNNNLVTTYAELVKGRNVLEKVIKNLKLDEDVDSLSDKVTVSTTSSTQIINVSVADESAINAKQIADEIAEVFVKEINDIFNLSNIYVVDKASYAEEAYNTNFIKDNIIYLVIGLIISVGLVTLIYTLDTSIKNSDMIEEKLGLVVLGDVPKVVDINE